MIIQKKDNLFYVQFSYRPYLVEGIKKIPGKRWHPDKKYWTVPVASEKELMEYAKKHNFKIIDEETVQEVIPEIKPLPELKTFIPLKKELYEYQKKGVAYGLMKKKVLIADAPGLGKTAQAIAMVTAMNAFPCLVICPNSLKENWVREWAMWTNHKAIVFSDSIKKTWRYFYESGMVDVFIVNYESLKKYFVNEIEKQEKKKLRLNHIKFNNNADYFKSVIVDEAHKIKDYKTQQAKFVYGIAKDKEYIILLTGTPVVNKPNDLITPLMTLGYLKYFGGYSNFVKTYCNEPNKNTLKKLNYLLNSYCYYRREKSEVLTELPPKQRQIIKCDITTANEYRAALYDLGEYLRKYKNATEEKVEKSLRGEIMVRIGILKDISARGKLNDVYEYIESILESGEKLVVFVHLREIAAKLKEKFPSCVTILGDDSLETRQRNIDQFQTNPDVKLIVASIKAGGVGITLTASSRVAFVELAWHPADMEQCEDRCHRIGQKDSVQCIYFLGNNTIDEWIYDLIESKRDMANTIMGSREEVETSIMDGVLNKFMQEEFLKFQ